MIALLRTASRLRSSHAAVPRTSVVTSVRKLLTLAIESSCDDTSVAIVEKTDTGNGPSALIHFHEKITSNNAVYGGVHPIASLESHQESLALLVNQAIQHLPVAHASEPASSIVHARTSDGILPKKKPDFISVTRGPGMRSNLMTGLDTAKGLAVAWQIPFLGVHHMQAHALTPRLVSALDGLPALEPRFPFLSLLVSGGHTLLILSASLTSHRILASTSNSAIGDCLDKIARDILPPSLVFTAKGTMYAALLTPYAFPSGASDWEASYTPPASQREELRKRMTKWGWGITPPFAESPNGERAKALEFSFTGFTTAVQRIAKYERHPDTGKMTDTPRDPSRISDAERRDLAREALRVTFEHLAGGVVKGLDHLSATEPDTAGRIDTLVVSGGVAANPFLRHVLARVLAARGYGTVRTVFPPPALCTDNAAMIAWTGLEMFGRGYRSELGVRVLRKWPLDRLLSAPNGD